MTYNNIFKKIGSRQHWGRAYIKNKSGDSKAFFTALLCLFLMNDNVQHIILPIYMLSFKDYPSSDYEIINLDRFLKPKTEPTSSDELTFLLISVKVFF